MDDKYIQQQKLVSQRKLDGLHAAVVRVGFVGSFTAYSLGKKRVFGLFQ